MKPDWTSLKLPPLYLSLIIFDKDKLFFLILNYIPCSFVKTEHFPFNKPKHTLHVTQIYFISTTKQSPRDLTKKMLSIRQHFLIAVIRLYSSLNINLIIRHRRNITPIKYQAHNTWRMSLNLKLTNSLLTYDSKYKDRTTICSKSKLLTIVTYGVTIYVLPLSGHYLGLVGVGT